jgi:hypothetical protein
VSITHAIYRINVLRIVKRLSILFFAYFLIPFDAYSSQNLPVSTDHYSLFTIDQNHAIPIGDQKNPCENNEEKEEKEEKESDDDDDDESNSHHLFTSVEFNSLSTEFNHSLKSHTLIFEQPAHVPLYILFHSWKNFLI